MWLVIHEVGAINLACLWLLLFLPLTTFWRRWTSKHGVYFDRWFFEARVFVATEHFEGCFYIYCTCLFSHCNAPIVSQQ